MQWFFGDTFTPYNSVVHKRRPCISEHLLCSFKWVVARLLPLGSLGIVYFSTPIHQAGYSIKTLCFYLFQTRSINKFQVLVNTTNWFQLRLNHENSSFSSRLYVVRRYWTKKADFTHRSQSPSCKILHHFGRSRRSKNWKIQDQRNRFRWNTILRCIRSLRHFHTTRSLTEGHLEKISIFSSPKSTPCLDNCIFRSLFANLSDLSRQLAVFKPATWHAC